MKTVIIILTLLLQVSISFSQEFTPKPQEFSGSTPLWYFYPKDVDFVRNSMDNPIANGYNSMAPYMIKSHNHDLYIRVVNKPYDYFGFTLFKVDGKSGNMQWKYKSNYSNSEYQQIPFDLVIDDCDVELLSAKAVNKPLANQVFKIGTNVYNFENIKLDCTNGNTVDYRHNGEVSNEANQTLNILIPALFFKLDNKYFFRRDYSIENRSTVLFPVMDDGAINFADTSIILPNLKYQSDTSVQIYPTSFNILEQNKRIINLECLIKSDGNHYCELAEVVHQGQHFEKKILNTQLGHMLQNSNTSGTVTIKGVNEDYVIQDYYYENKDNLLVFKSNLIWLDHNGKLKRQVSDVAVGTHHYNYINSFYSNNEKLYLLARPSKHAPYEGMGFDVLEINLAGDVKEVGYLYNKNPVSILNDLSPMVTDDGILVFFSYDRLLNQSGAQTAAWFTLYGFDAKSLGVDFISSIQEGQDVSLKLYPNPAHDVLTLDHPNILIKDIQVVDISGCLKLNAVANIDQTILHVDMLIPGIYLVIATDDLGHKYHQKLVIQ